jgi:hypothetical protein
LLSKNTKIKIYKTNRVLSRIFRPKRDEGTGKWRNLHKQELNDLYSSPNIVWAINLRRIGWAKHVARIGRIEVFTGFLWGNLRERDHLEDADIDGGIILRWILGEWGVTERTGSMFLKIGTGGGNL